MLLTDGTRAFFEAFSDHISVRRFDYAAEVATTELGSSTFFGCEATIKAALQSGKHAAYSDLVRYIALHNYGGLWCAPCSSCPGLCTSACTCICMLA